MLDKGSLIKKIIPILRKHSVIKASLFGSIVNGNTHDSSDVDILVELPQDSTLINLVGLKQALEDALGLEVDVLTFNSINPKLEKYILTSQEAII